MSTSTQQSASLSRREFVTLATKASASTLTGYSGGVASNLTPMRNSRKSFEDAGTLAAKAAASGTSYPDIDHYRKHVSSLPKLSVIVLTRLGFGPTPEDIAAFENMGVTDEERLNNWADKQLNPESIADSDCDARIQEAGFVTPGKTLKQAWLEHRNSSDYWWRILPVMELERLNFLRAAHSKKQLLEVLVDFWHNHFNVYGWDGYIASVFMNWDEEVIRKHAFGNFREMIEAATKHPAMLYYLDNYTNTASGFNENFARELFELHSMGAENYFGVIPRDEVPTFTDGTPRGYVDADVYDAAECFTGWTINQKSESDGYGGFAFVSDNHSKGEKRVLKQVIDAFGGESDGQTVLDLVANHPGTARYIARKLCRRLITDNPPETLVAEIAEVFMANRDQPDQLKRVVRAVILSDAFRNTFGEKVKRPFEQAVSAFRATGADWNWKMDSKDADRAVTSTPRLTWNWERLLLRPPNPVGWPVPWIPSRICHPMSCGRFSQPAPRPRLRFSASNQP